MSLRLHLIAALLASALVAAFAAPGDPATPAAAGATPAGEGQTLGDVLQMFNLIDSDHNNKITAAEFRQIFVAADKNGDGFLTATEFPPEQIAALDNNKDAKLSPTEFMAVFDLSDANRDGAITVNEFGGKK